MQTLTGITGFNPLEIVLSVLDIGLVAYVLYRLFILIRGTRAVQLINGIFVLLLANAASRALNLYTLKWLLDQAIFTAAVALPVVFQPELRRALETLGRGRFIPTTGISELNEEDVGRVLDQVVKCTEILSRNKTGALVVLERETKLGEVIDSGIKIEGYVSWELFTNIFIENTPLHDGAVIVRGNRVMAAACWLPLAEATFLAHELGTRHRAAVGVTEHSDAIAVVVSEETGTISVAHGGKLIRDLDEKALRELLTALLVPKSAPGRTFWSWGNAS